MSIVLAVNTDNGANCSSLYEAAAMENEVSHSCACIGSPCLRHCVHGASIGHVPGLLHSDVCHHKRHVQHALQWRPQADAPPQHGEGRRCRHRIQQQQRRGPGCGEGRRCSWGRGLAAEYHLPPPRHQYHWRSGTLTELAEIYVFENRPAELCAGAGNTICGTEQYCHGLSSTLLHADCVAWKDFWITTNGSSWSGVAGFVDPCALHGRVSCSQVGGQLRITAIQLANSGLVGFIPPELSGLQALRSFVVSGNLGLSGSVLPALPFSQYHCPEHKYGYRDPALTEIYLYFVVEIGSPELCGGAGTRMGAHWMEQPSTARYLPGSRPVTGQGCHRLNLENLTNASTPHPSA
jgi:hypothetical protein